MINIHTYLYTISRRLYIYLLVGLYVYKSNQWHFVFFNRKDVHYASLIQDPTFNSAKRVNFVLYNNTLIKLLPIAFSKCMINCLYYTIKL